MDTTHRSMSERFRKIREELNQPASYITKQLELGYSEAAYSSVEAGRTKASVRFCQRIELVFHVNPAFLRDGEEPVLLEDSRKRGSEEQIRKRILELDPAWDESQVPGKAERLSMHYLEEQAERLDVGMDYLMCGDEKSRRWPCDRRMAAWLKGHEESRKKVWMQMNPDFDPEEEYQAIREDGNVESIARRIWVLKRFFGRKRLCEMAGLNYAYLGKSDEEINKATDLVLTGIAQACHVSLEWIKAGEQGNCFYPYDFFMKIFLQEHEEVRKKIHAEMYPEKQLDWAEKFRMIRESLGWPNKHLTEYLGAGHKGNMFFLFESTGKKPPEYLLDDICDAFMIDRNWMITGQGTMLLNRSRVRSEDAVIKEKLGVKKVPRSLKKIQQMAEQKNMGLEYVLCGDELAKENPCGFEMQAYLRNHEEIRKEIWEQMPPVKLPDYRVLREKTMNMEERLRLLMKAFKMDATEFANLLHMTPEYFKNLGHYVPTIQNVTVYRIASAASVSIEWIREGRPENLAYPCEQRMIRFLRTCPDLRKRIVQQMRMAK